MRPARVKPRALQGARICLDPPPSLAPREYRCEHTSYFATDGERHPATLCPAGLHAARAARFHEGVIAREAVIMAMETE